MKRKLIVSFFYCSLYFSYYSSIYYYTNPFIWLVFWIIKFFNVSNLLSFSNRCYCYAHSLFENEIKDWTKLVSMYFFSNYSIVNYLCDCLWTFVGDYFFNYVLFYVMLLCKDVFLGAFFKGDFCDGVNIYGRAREEVMECRLELRLKLF